MGVVTLGCSKRACQSCDQTANCEAADSTWGGAYLSRVGKRICIARIIEPQGEVSFMHFFALRAFLIRLQDIAEEIKTLATVQNSPRVIASLTRESSSLQVQGIRVTVPLPMCNHRLPFRLSQRHFLRVEPYSSKQSHQIVGTLSRGRRSRSSRPSTSPCCNRANNLVLEANLVEQAAGATANGRLVVHHLQQALPDLSRLLAGIKGCPDARLLVV